MSQNIDEILGWFLEDEPDEALLVTVEVTHPNGRHQVINATVLLKEAGQDISDEMMLRFVNQVGRITGRLRRNQKYILVERDEKV